MPLPKLARCAAALAAVLAVIAVAVGCGGDDSSDAPAPATVTVTAPATAAAPTATVPVEVTTPETTPVPADGGEALSPEGAEMAVQVYKDMLGLSDDEARCLVGKLPELVNEDGFNPNDVMGSGVLGVLQECGIDLQTLMQRMSERR